MSEQIDAELLAIRSNPRFIALKNKNRTPQDNDKFNIYLRREAKLESQKLELRAKKTDYTGTNTPTYVGAKPVWRNQPKVIASRNQDQGKVSRNWVRHPVTLDEIVPKPISTAQPANVKTETPNTAPPVVDEKTYVRKPKRTPTELKKFEETTDRKKDVIQRVVKPRVVPRKSVKKVRARPVTRKTAPPVIVEAYESSSEEIVDEVVPEGVSPDGSSCGSEEGESGYSQEESGSIIDDLDE